MEYSWFRCSYYLLLNDQVLLGSQFGQVPPDHCFVLGLPYRAAASILALPVPSVSRANTGVSLASSQLLVAVPAPPLGMELRVKWFNCKKGVGATLTVGAGAGTGARAGEGKGARAGTDVREGAGTGAGVM